jgi:hypothetical protein
MKSVARRLCAIEYIPIVNCIVGSTCYADPLACLDAFHVCILCAHSHRKELEEKPHIPIAMATLPMQAGI